MSDGAALVAAIEADPDADLPRLLWADWLDDHGRPERAELVRVQCAPDQSRGLVRREGQLLDALARDWPADLLPPGHVFLPGGRRLGSSFCIRPKFVRGCLTGVVFALCGYERAADRFAGREPLLEVHLLNTGRVPRRLAASPHLRRVSTLDGHGAVGLVASPNLLRLRIVSRCAPADVTALAHSPAAGRVQALTVDGRDAPGPPAELARVLANTPAFANLRLLTLGDCRLAAADLRVLIGSPHLPRTLNVFVCGRGQPRDHSAVLRDLRARFPGPAAT